ncbi:hypothetical protein EPR50_G00244630, partial [Perca flavescens]
MSRRSTFRCPPQTPPCRLATSTSKYGAPRRRASCRSCVCSRVWCGSSRSSSCGTEPQPTGTRAERTCSCRGRGAQVYTPPEPPLVRVSRGPVFSEITSCFRHFTHTVRLYHLDGHAGRSLEISNTVDIRSEVNRELAMRLVSDVANGNRFYSDLNGFQMQQRRTLAKLPLQANFYPMSTAAFLQDSTSRLTLLAAQSQAVAALRP